MHKKINYLVPVFILGLSLIFLSFPSRSMATEYTILKPEDEVPAGTICIPISELGAYDITDDSFGVESTVGEYVWIAPIPASNGTTGTTEEKEFKDKWRCTCNGIVDTCHKSNTGKSSRAKCEECCPCGYYNICRNSNLAWLPWVDGSILYCKPAKWCEVKEEDECQIDADCRNGGTTTPTLPKYSCSGTPNYTCSQVSNGVYSSLDVCEDNCVKPSAWSPPPASPPPASPPPVSPPPVSPPPVSPPVSECKIEEFSINGKTNEDRDPLLVWVNASLKGLVSTNTDCIKCTVESTDTWGNDPDPKEYAINFANNYKAKETFTILESGTYEFTVTCQGSDPDDIVVDNFSLETVEAINLPWWREIIPVLPGFLRGIWK